MFTGIVEEQGVIESIETRGAGARFRIRARTVLEDAVEGASIAVNGVCLTAVGLRPGSFGADVSPETFRRSNLPDLRIGSPVNLERPLSPSGRLGGHIVQGHVDGTGELLSLELLGDENWWLTVRYPDELDPYLVFKGSVAVDGISLTIARMEAETFSVTVIPHTFANTTLRNYRPGARVNLECDILAKYVAKLLGAVEKKSAFPSIEQLRDMGY